MNALLLSDVTLEDEYSRGAFELAHGVMHETTYERMLARGLVPLHFPLGDFPREGGDDYLLAHWEEHRSIARLLNLPDIPDLATVDLSDPDQAADWLELHAFVHRNENLALGIR